MKIHSVIDVITNSSSELFICDTDKTINMVSEILDELVEVYKKATGDQRSISEMLFVTELQKNNAIAIMGTEDNSIPWALFKFIEEVFNAKRYHLG